MHSMSSFFFGLEHVIISIYQYFSPLNLVIYEIHECVLLILQLKRVMESDAAMTEDLIAYNIIPLDAPTMTNAIGLFPEVCLFLI